MASAAPTRRTLAIRRYPVKSMGGEALAAVRLNSRGLEGDRYFAVVDAQGRLASGKNTRRMVRRDGVFSYAARTEADAVMVTGEQGIWRAGDAALDAELSYALGAEVMVLPETTTPYFDDGAVSLIGTATLEWCARELGADADQRRLRANLLVETAEPFEEETWTGPLAIGTAVLRPVARIERCRTIDLPQDGVATGTRWLKPLGDARAAKVGIYCDVEVRGLVTVGDVVNF